MENIKDSKFFKDGKFQYPKDAWVLIRAYKCSNCGEVITMRPQTVCPGCRASMKMSIY